MHNLSASEEDDRPVLVDDPLPGARRLTLNRPRKLNALSRDLVQQLVAELIAAENDPEVRVVILQANGRSFSAGADFDEHFQEGGYDIGHSDLWERLESLRVPVIAAVQGWAVTGGFLMAYCCDIVVAAEDAIFRDTHGLLGLFPTGGESQRMPRRLGAFVARDLMLTSRPMKADEAHRIGFVSRVVPRDQLEGAALDVARQILGNSPRSVPAIKRLINLGTQADMGVGMRLELEISRFGLANQEEDADRLARLRSVRPRT